MTPTTLPRRSAVMPPAVDMVVFEDALQQEHGHLYSVRSTEALILAREWGDISSGIAFKIQRSGFARYVIQEDDKHTWHICSPTFVARGDVLDVCVNSGCYCDHR